jgi:AMP nucleosidase
MSPSRAPMPPRHPARPVPQLPDPADRAADRNHGVPVTIGPSDTPIPVHFAVANDRGRVTVPQEGALDFPLRDVFDVPDLSTTNDDIVNGTALPRGRRRPLAPFTAQRVDYSLARLAHYTATAPSISRTTSCSPTTSSTSRSSRPIARAMLADPDSGYTSFVGRETSRSPTPTRRCPCPRSCRRCRPIT